jgi:hypothetical protein
VTDEFTVRREQRAADERIGDRIRAAFEGEMPDITLDDVIARANDPLTGIKTRRDARRSDWRQEFAFDGLGATMHRCKLCRVEESIFDGIGHTDDCPVELAHRAHDADVDDLIGEVERLRSLLGRLEFAAPDDYGDRDACPVCYGGRSTDHDPTCWLAKELRP